MKQRQTLVLEKKITILGTTDDLYQVNIQITPKFPRSPPLLPHCCMVTRVSEKPPIPQPIPSFPVPHPPPQGDSLALVPKQDGNQRLPLSPALPCSSCYLKTWFRSQPSHFLLSDLELGLNLSLGQFPQQAY